MADLSKLRFNGTDYNVKDASAPLRKFTNYSKTGNLPITSDDTTQTAIGKLEKALDDKINTSAKGTASGVAELDTNGKVPSSQLPSYVDDVLEYSAKSSFPATGETGKIYVDTTTNKTYRWSGSAYVEISESLALGETSSTAYRGDRGKAAYNHSQITNGNPHGTTGANTNLTGYSKGSSKDAVTATDTVNAAIAKHENRINANQTNILYGLNTGVKNIIDFSTGEITPSVTTHSVTWTIADNKGVVANGTSDSSGSYPSITKLTLPVGTYKMSGGTSRIKFQCGNIVDSGSGATFTVNENTTQPVTFIVYATPNTTFSNETIYPMLCTEEAWNQSHDYQPPALPNYDLTYLQAEDRAALAEVVDSGAKNLVDWRNTVSFQNVTIDNGTYTTGVDSLTTLRFQVAAIDSNGGQIMAFNGNGAIPTANGVINIPFTVPSGTAKIRAGHNGSTYNGRFDIPLSGTTLEVGKSYVLQVNVTQYTNSSGIFKWKDLMICTKAAFGVSQKFVPFGNDPFYQVPINHNMIYRGQNLGATLTNAQHTALSSGNFTDLYLGDYWTKTVTIPAGTYTGGDGKEVTVPAQTNITLKAVIADFDTFYAGYDSNYAGINTHHASVIVTGFSNVVWNKTDTTDGGYANSLINKWLVGSALPQIETWFGSAKVLSHKKLLTIAITDSAASRWDWISQKISLLSENQVYGSKVWGNSKAANGAYEPGEAFKHLNVFNHIGVHLLFGNKPIWLRDIATAWEAALFYNGYAYVLDTSNQYGVPAALILLS